MLFFSGSLFFILIHPDDFSSWKFTLFLSTYPFRSFVFVDTHVIFSFSLMSFSINENRAVPHRDHSASQISVIILFFILMWTTHSTLFYVSSGTDPFSWVGDFDPIFHYPPTLSVCFFMYGIMLFSNFLCYIRFECFCVS